jgi:hypothetical protein
MFKQKKVTLKGKQIAKRLTGISTPIGGISWTPPVDERDVAKKLLVFLEDRRALFMFTMVGWVNRHKKAHLVAPAENEILIFRGIHREYGPELAERSWRNHALH